MIKIELKGMNQALDFVKKKSKEAEKLVNTGIKNATLHITNEVKESIAGNRPELRSVDTGRFLNSITPDVKNGVVSSSVPYSVFLEYGTVKFQGRKHFQNTANREKDKVKRIIQTEVNKL